MKILVAVDGSKPALHAVKYAIDLSTKLSDPTHITLVSAHDDAGLRHVRKHVPAGSIQDHLRELSEADLKAARKLLDKAGVPHDMVIKVGHVAEQIVRTANAGKFDLLVLGSKGRSGFSDLLLGSVAQRVASSASQPVVLVK
jgi:nucleotide-binding universal stress UspA family protein